MLRRRSSWQIGDAEEEVDFPLARKINDLKPIFSIILIPNPL